MLVEEKNKQSEIFAGWNKGAQQKQVTQAMDKEANDIIEAYLKGLNVGKLEGSKEIKNRIIKDYASNIKKVRNIAEHLYSFINDEKKMGCSSVFLRITDITRFDLLFLINSQDYLSTKFNSVYKRSISEKAKVNSQNFHVTILFIPEVSTLDRKKIARDGYEYHYGEAK